LAKLWSSGYPLAISSSSFWDYWNRFSKFKACLSSF
jgi:hypothetical protein